MCAYVSSQHHSWPSVNVYDILSLWLYYNIVSIVALYTGSRATGELYVFVWYIVNRQYTEHMHASNVHTDYSDDHNIYKLSTILSKMVPETTELGF